MNLPATVSMVGWEIGAGLWSSNLADEAVAYAARGWRVFPLHSIRDGRCSCGGGCGSPGKHPRTRNGVKDATTDPGQIGALWRKWPDANIGLATGNGLVVLDVDPDKGGSESIEVLLDGRPPWRTPIVITGGNGLHFYFRTDRKVRNAVNFRKLAGIDVRGEGGYVVAPPSGHVKGTYKWDAESGPDTPLAEWPFDHEPSQVAAQPASEESIRDGTIPEGRRNDTLLRFAGAMRRAGMSREAIESALLAENARCTPPLWVEEVRRIAASIVRYKAVTGGKSVEARLGTLAMLPWVPLPVVALRHRSFGVTPAEFEALLAILAHYYDAGVWRSWGQEVLARTLGVDRRTLGHQLLQLRRKGLLAVRPDPAQGRRADDPARKSTLRYCAEPFLIVLALRAAHDRAGTSLGEALHRSREERLAEFIRQVNAGMWSWRFGEVSSDEGHVAEEIAEGFLAAYGGAAERVGINTEPHRTASTGTEIVKRRSETVPKSAAWGAFDLGVGASTPKHAPPDGEA